MWSGREFRSLIWRLLAQVLQCPEGSGAWQDDEGSLRTLAAFVVAHCPPDQVRRLHPPHL